jgi:predicted metal-dependent hydrolase
VTLPSPIEGVEVVRNARARRARLSVDPASGRVRLTLPRRAALGQYAKWVEDHRDWIDTQRARLPQPRPFVDGAAIPLGDDLLTIDWDETRQRTIRREGERLMCGGPPEALARRVEAWLKREAKRLLAEETAYYAAKAGVTVDSVSIGDPKGRWGSCTSSGRIRYSWRLILAPSHVRRSTVAHEVAHRIHLNHSPAFHALADSLFEGDPKPSRAWFRANGASLHWYGRES